MTITDDLTPTQYSIGSGKMVIRGKTVETIRIQLGVRFYNAAGAQLDSRYVDLSFTDPQKQALIDAVASKIAELEADTGFTPYTPPEEPF